MKTKRYFTHPGPYAIALFVTVLYFNIPLLAKWIIAHPTFSGYAGKHAASIARVIQDLLLYPFGKLLKGNLQHLLVLPYWIVVLLFIRAVYINTKRFWKYFSMGIIALLIVLFAFPNILLFGESPKLSHSDGSVANGSIEYSKRIPFRGGNYTTYSFLCYLAGRTFVHDRVRKTIVESYQKCITTVPNRTFVIGETGCKNGGQFLPHRTHRNGLSVDFMTPLLKKGKPYHSNHLFNVWGYALEFDNNGFTKKTAIDYEAMAQHLLALEKAAEKNRLKIQKVIFDPILQAHLLSTDTGKKIKHLPFTKNRVIVRHDDHYHVDFKVLGFSSNLR